MWRLVRRHDKVFCRVTVEGCLKHMPVDAMESERSNKTRFSAVLNTVGIEQVVPDLPIFHHGGPRIGQPVHAPSALALKVTKA